MTDTLKKTFILLIILSSCLPSLIAADETLKNLPLSKVLILKIDSTINPGTLNYLKTGFQNAAQGQVNLIVIKMNTPGGLVTTTKSILTLIGDSSIPVAVWVTPEGASATSAGAIISAGAHFLFMSPGTNIGAATPITLTGDEGGSVEEEKEEKKKEKKGKKEKVEKEDHSKALEEAIKKHPIFSRFSKGNKKSDMKAKAINDLVALVKSLSQARGRNAELFAEMIKAASSFEANVALKKGLINGIINNLPELLQKLNQKEVQVKGVKYILEAPGPKTTPPTIIEHKMDLGQEILDILANPSLAYILFLLGAALIYLELQAPGGFIAGSIGAICLVLAGIAFQVLPLNFGSLSLIVLSFILFVLEIYITSYGILTLAGLISLIFGSLFLFRSENSYLEINESVIFAAVSAVALFVIIMASYWIYDSKKKKNIRKQNDHHMLIGQKGIVVDIIPHGNQNMYQLKTCGEIWMAQTQSTKAYQIGEEVTILEIDMEKLHLEI